MISPLPPSVFHAGLALRESSPGQNPVAGLPPQTDVSCAGGEVRTRYLAALPAYFMGRSKPQIRLATYVTDPENGKPQRIQHTTAPFREPAAFGPLGALLADPGRGFAEGTPIEIYAASDGADALTTALVLLDSLGIEKAASYPIIACDLHPQNFARARRGIMGFPQFDSRVSVWSALERQWLHTSLLSEGCMQGRLSDYLDPAPLDRKHFDFLSFKDKFDPKDTGFAQGKWVQALGREDLFRLKPEIRKQVRSMIHFRRKPVDVVEAMAKRPRNQRPRIVMIRNVIYLIPEERRRLLLEHLRQNMPVGSLLVIGQSEYDVHPYEKYDPEVFHQALRDAGFEQGSSPFHYFKAR